MSDEHEYLRRHLEIADRQTARAEAGRYAALARIEQVKPLLVALREAAFSAYRLLPGPLPPSIVRVVTLAAEIRDRLDPAQFPEGSDTTL